MSTGFDISDWLDMMADTVTVYAWTGKSVSGAPTYSGSGTSYPCYISMINHKIVTNDGKEILAKGRVILGSAAVIGVKDKIVLPADYVPIDPPILGIDVINDEAGNHHTTVHI